MDQRFIIRTGASHFIGEPGARSDNRDGILKLFPTSLDGNVEEGTTFEDLATGLTWYYDGEGWKRWITGHDRVIAEVRQMRQELSKQNDMMIELLTEMRDALLKIA